MKQEKPSPRGGAVLRLGDRRRPSPRPSSSPLSRRRRPVRCWGRREESAAASTGSFHFIDGDGRERRPGVARRGGSSSGVDDGSPIWAHMGLGGLVCPPPILPAAAAFSWASPAS
jgi:hypothetical protein